MHRVTDPVAAFIVAGRDPSDEHLTAFASVVPEDVRFLWQRGNHRGIDAIATALRSPFMIALQVADWDEPATDGAITTVTATYPAAALSGGSVFEFLREGGRVVEIRQRVLPPQPLTASPILLSDELKETIDGAYPRGNPILSAYVDRNGWSRLSYRGSAQAFGDDALALWARDANGGMPTSVRERPHVTLLYREASPPVYSHFYGRARVVEDDATNQRIYEAMVKTEQDADPNRDGVGIVVDLDRVEGIERGMRVLMARDRQ